MTHVSGRVRRMTPIARLVQALIVTSAALAMAAFGAACSGDESAQPTVAQPPTAPPTTTREAPATNRPHAKPTQIVVRDGDTGKLLRDAVIRFGRAGRVVTRSGGHAHLVLGAHRRVRVSVRRPDYMPERMTVRTRKGGQHVEVRLYRRAVQWPIYGANRPRTQTHPAIKLRPPFRRVWKRGVGSLIEFPAVVWKGVAYVDSMQGVMTAISMRSGKVVWRRQIGTRMAASPAVVPERNELVVVTMSPGELVVLNLETGRVKYRRYIGRAEPSAVVRNGIAYFGAANGVFHAFNVRRRAFLWQRSLGAKITASAALVGNRLYVGDYAGRVFCLSARTGRTIWTSSAGSRVYGTAAVADEKVFVPFVFSGLSALSARTGRLLWRNSDGTYHYAAPAYYHGRVYYGSYAGRVYSADADSGHIRWVRETRRAVSGAVQVVAGVVYAGSFDHRIAAWNWRSGRLLWRFPHGKYVSVSGNGGRLLMHGVRKVYAVQPPKHHKHGKHEKKKHEKKS